MKSQGMLQLYIGNGKGKTTAAIGLAIRALGRGYRVLFAQFLKSADTGERIILDGFPEQVYFFRPKQRHHAFLWDMTPAQVQETKEDLQHGWESLKTEISTGHWDIVVLDEILDCIECNLLDGDDILSAIASRPSGIEVICTGRNASKDFLEKADYVSRIDAVKHPYQKGMNARRGIEF